MRPHPSRGDDRAGVAGTWSTVLTALALFLSGCSAPNMRNLAQFPATPDLQGEIQKGETCEVRACRLGDPCLKELFKTGKVGKSFIVYWVDLTALTDVPVQVARSRIWLNVGNIKIFPVDPGRVAYLSSAEAYPFANLAWVFWPVAMAGLDSVDSANARRLQGTGTNALPESVTVQPGSTLSGFVYFEPPLKRKGPMKNIASIGSLELTVPIKTGEKEESVSLRNIPVVNPVLKKEG